MLSDSRAELVLEGEIVYNKPQPRYIYGYLTPEEFFELRQQNNREEEVSVRYREHIRLTKLEGVVILFCLCYALALL
jgi:hypothetical protein